MAVRGRTTPLGISLVTVGLSLSAAFGLALVPVTAGASNDPGFSRQWNLDKIGAPAAWTRTTGRGVRVGIVDAGVDLQHEDLAGKVVAETSCINAAGDTAKCQGSGQDDQGHGTH